jgi:CubicO group peptidase (beta-lactamase class C family)
VATVHVLHSLNLALLESAAVPGLSAAMIGRGMIEHAYYLGVRDIRTKEPVNAGTVFEAASLSKPVVAYAALQLVDPGKLDLDEPLSHIVPVLVPDESSDITARHVLTHTTGLPNWNRSG